MQQTIDDAYKSGLTQCVYIGVKWKITALARFYYHSYQLDRIDELTGCHKQLRLHPSACIEV